MSDQSDMASLPPERWKRMYPVYSRSSRGPYFLPEERASHSKMQVAVFLFFGVFWWGFCVLTLGLVSS
jgi:hypothetical protein